MNIENKTNEEIEEHIIKMRDSYNKTGKDLYLKIKAECEAELKRRADQKKSQSLDPAPKESNAQEFFKKQAQEYRESGRNDLADKVEQEVQNMHRDQMESEKAFDEYRKADEEWENTPIEEKRRQHRNFIEEMDKIYIKTVKAPDFEVDYADLINVTLTNSKGGEFVRTHTKAQVKANCRKYFANVLQTRINGNDKLGVGFKNLLAYFVAWMELNQVAPELKDVLQDYSKYKRGDERQEPSEAFKIAQQLYAKLISLTTKKEKANGGQ